MEQSSIPAPDPNPASTDEAQALKHKLSELQQHLTEMETELDSLRHKKNIFDRQTWQTWLAVLLVFLLGVIPPALVISQRWLYLMPGDWHREIWCQVGFFCNTIFPSYFFIILACWVVLLVVLLFLGKRALVVSEQPLVVIEDFQVDPQQKQRGFYALLASGLGMLGVVTFSLATQTWPGWDLVVVWLLYLAGWAMRAVPLKYVISLWENEREYWISLLLAHLATVAVLAGYYDVTQIFYLALVLLVLAFGNLWRFRKRVPLIFWVISLALVFYTININAWWTSVIGDDFGFHEIAWQFAEKMNFFQVGHMLFKADGVDGTHPYFSSFVQAISIKLLGHDSFGWRFSSLYL